MHGITSCDDALKKHQEIGSDEEWGTKPIDKGLEEKIKMM